METLDHAIPQLHDYLQHSARRLPDKVALVCRGQRLTYAELDERSNALAHALVRRGVQRGDRVVVFADNTVETVISFWAVLKANAVVSMVNPLTKVDKLAYLLNDCRAAGLITDAHLAGVVAEAARRGPHLRTLLVSGALDAAPLGDLPAASFEGALAAEPTDSPPPRTNLDIDLAAIIYTSGSTGDPKGVMLTHRNMLTAATSITTYLRNVEDDVILGVLPLAFDYGLYQMIMAFRMGARLVLERSFAYPAQVLSLMANEGVTGFPGVPTIFAILAELKSLETYDLSRIRYVTNTAAALPVKHIRMLQRLFPQARIYSMYGLTECKRCTYLPPEDLDRKPDSVGIAIPNTELWLVDEEGRRLGAERGGPARHPRRHGDAGLLGEARGDGEEAPARAAARRAGALHRRLLPARRGGLPVLRRPHGRHHQVPRREGGAQGGRERPHQHPGRQGGGGDRRPRRAARPGGQGLRRPRGRSDAHRGGAPARVPGPPGDLHGPPTFVLVPALPKTSTGKIKKTELI